MNHSVNSNLPGSSPAVGSRPTLGSWIKVGIAWLLVIVPLAWGVYKTLEKAVILFRS
jgi:hypothetical protein